MKKLFLIVLMFVAVSVNAQWVQSNGPGGNNIYVLYKNGTALYAGTFSDGIMISTNEGLSWKFANNGLSNLEIGAFSSVGTNIFVGTKAGVYLSTNNGDNWSARNSGITNLDIRSLASSGNSIYAGTFGNGIFMSTNNGINWVSINNGSNIYNVYSILISGTNIYLGTSPTTGVFVSTNSGSSWSQRNNGLTNANVFSLALSGSYLFAATSGGGVFVSTNNGYNWSACNNGLSNSLMNKIFVVGTDLYLGTYAGGAFKSTNNGANWIPINNGLNSLFVYDFESVGEKIFCGSAGGLLSTTNSGNNWNNTGLPTKNIYSLSTRGSDIFAGTNDGGVFISSDNAVSWRNSRTGMTDLDIRCFGFSGSNILAGSYTSGIFISTDDGYNWARQNNSLMNSQIFSFLNTGSQLLTGTSQGLFISTDNGLNWQISDLTYSVVNISKSGANIFASTGGFGVYKSTNNGNNWFSSNNGIPYNGTYCTYGNGNNIYAGTVSGVWKSTNAGTLWDFCGLQSRFVFSLTGYDSVVIAGNLDVGVYLSTNNGLNWISKNQGIDLPTYGRSLTIANGYIFVGTSNHSVYRRLLTEITSVNNISTEIPSAYSLGQNYPNPFNPTTTIKFSVPNGFPIKTFGNDNVVLKVYDATGRDVETLVNERLQPGTYSTQWNASAYSSGVYFYRIIAGEFSETKRMLLIK